MRRSARSEGIFGLIRSVFVHESELLKESETECGDHLSLKRDRLGVVHLAREAGERVNRAALDPEVAFEGKLSQTND